MRNRQVSNPQPPAEAGTHTRTHGVFISRSRYHLYIFAPASYVTGIATSLNEILENHGIHVQTLKVKRFGYVVYEDEYRLVAEPFADVNC